MTAAMGAGASERRGWMMIASLLRTIWAGAATSSAPCVAGSPSSGHQYLGRGWFGNFVGKSGVRCGLSRCRLDVLSDRNGDRQHRFTGKWQRLLDRPIAAGDRQRRWRSAHRPWGESTQEHSPTGAAARLFFRKGCFNSSRNMLGGRLHVSIREVPPWRPNR